VTAGPAERTARSAASGALGRVIRRRSAVTAATVERCDLCAVTVPERHRHVLDLRSSELQCVCPGCALLFEREAAGRGHYRLVPRDRLRLPEFAPAELGVPVGLAFFVVGAAGGTVAHYPSPVGATEWDVDADAWREARERCPALRDLQPGVQAFLVNTARGAREHWIVPIDDCYRLVALIRAEWTGLSGGDRVWPAIDRFFEGLHHS
jgi:Family of unknown function (DUF5947)